MTLIFSPAILVTLYRQRESGGPLSPENIILMGVEPTVRNIVMLILSRGGKAADQILKVGIPAQDCVAPKELTREDLCLAAHVLATSWEARLEDPTQEDDKSAALSALLEKLYAGFPEVPRRARTPEHPTSGRQKDPQPRLWVWFERSKLDYSLSDVPVDDRAVVLALLNAVPLEKIPHMRGIQIGDRAWGRDKIMDGLTQLKEEWSKTLVRDQAPNPETIEALNRLDRILLPGALLVP